MYKGTARFSLEQLIDIDPVFLVTEMHTLTWKSNAWLTDKALRDGVVSQKNSFSEYTFTQLLA